MRAADKRRINMCWLADYLIRDEKTLLLESQMLKLSVYGLSEIKVLRMGH